MICYNQNQRKIKSSSHKFTKLTINFSNNIPTYYESLQQNIIFSLSWSNLILKTWKPEYPVYLPTFFPFTRLLFNYHFSTMFCDIQVVTYSRGTFVVCRIISLYSTFNILYALCNIVHWTRLHSLRPCAAYVHHTRT